MTWSEMRDRIVGNTNRIAHRQSPPFAQVASKDTRRELNESKQMIQDQLGKSITSFSYPYAFPEQDGAFLRQLRQSGSCGIRIMESLL